MIPVNEPLLNGNEKKYLQECIDTGWISSEGPFIKKFEDGLAAMMNRKYGVAVSNGSVAIDAAIVGLGIGEGDEVIMPTFTIISCAAAVVRAGAKPILVDSDPLTFNMNVGEIEEKITDRTKAIMVVHIYGFPVDMDPVLDIAQKHRLFVIEDSAEMHGQYYYDRPCGSFGDISTLSFYPNKHITTGEGGMILTNNSELAEKCRSLRNLCFKPEQRFVHDEIGWNLRMTNLQAAIGVAQLERLDEFVVRKRQIGKLYTELLSDVEEIQLPIKEMSFAKNIYWVYSIVLKETCKYNAREIAQKLASKGVATRPFFWPMHEQPVFIKKGWYQNEKYPVAENIARKGFYLPSGLGLTDDQIVEAVKIFKNIIANG